MAPVQNHPRGSYKMSKAAGKGEKKAFVTFLGGGGDYVKGVIGLAKGLKKVNSAYPLVVAVLPDVPQEHRLLMLQNGCVLKDIDWVQPPKLDKTIGWAHEHFAINYSKLRIFQVLFTLLLKLSTVPVFTLYFLVRCRCSSERGEKT